MNGFSIPGSEQAGKKVIPVDLGDCAAEKLGNFFGRGSLAGHHGEKRRKIEGVDSFQLLHRCFNLVAAKSISARQFAAEVSSNIPKSDPPSPRSAGCLRRSRSWVRP